MKLLLITLVGVVVGLMVACGEPEPVVIPETGAQAIAYVRAALNERETVGTPGENCLEGIEDFAKENNLPQGWIAERSYDTGWIWRVSSGSVYDWVIFDEAKGNTGRSHGRVSSHYPYTPC
jgi:hypothetical protein